MLNFCSSNAVTLYERSFYNDEEMMWSYLSVWPLYHLYFESIRVGLVLSSNLKNKHTQLKYTHIHYLLKG